MNKTLKLLGLVFVGTAILFAKASPAKAAGCDDQASYGVNSTSGGSLAGLVVHTQWIDNGGGVHQFNTNVNVTSTNYGDGIANTGTGGNAGWIVGTTNTRGFTSGETFWQNFGNQDPCNKQGYLVLGYGTTKAGAPHYSYGNRWSLQCHGGATQFRLDVGPGPSGVSGHWVNHNGASSTSDTFTTSNGQTIWRDFKFIEDPVVQQPPPPPPPTGGTVQGYKVNQRLWNSPKKDIGGEQSSVRIKKVAVNVSDNNNPYSLNSGSGNNQKIGVVTNSMPAGWEIQGYTACTNRTNCHSVGEPGYNLKPIDGTQAGIDYALVDVPAGGYVDLWWHFKQPGTVTGQKVANVNGLPVSQGANPPSNSAISIDTGQVMSDLGNGFFQFNAVQTTGGGNRTITATDVPGWTIEGYTVCRYFANDNPAEPACDETKHSQIQTGTRVGSSVSTLPIQLTQGGTIKILWWFKPPCSVTLETDLGEVNSDETFHLSWVSVDAVGNLTPSVDNGGLFPTQGWSGAGSKQPNSGFPGQPGSETNPDPLVDELFTYTLSCTGSGGVTRTSNPVLVNVKGVSGPTPPTPGPYLTTLLGDVQAGGKIVFSGSCTRDNTLSKIKGQAANPSKADFIVSAGGTIAGFQSAGGAGGGTSLTQVDYNKVCRPDLAKAADNSPSIPFIPPLARRYTGNPVLRFNGDLDLDGISALGDPPPASGNGRFTLYVNGNVHIKSNIQYSTLAYLRGALPSFGLIASGNIYIDPAVTKLEGFYYAKGSINTCATGFADNVPNLNAAAGVTQCLPALQVNGLLTAGSLQLRRTTPPAACSSPNPDPAIGCASEATKFYSSLYVATPPVFSDFIQPQVSRPKFQGDLPPLF